MRSAPQPRRATGCLPTERAAQKGSLRTTRRKRLATRPHLTGSRLGALNLRMAFKTSFLHQVRLGTFAVIAVLSSGAALAQWQWVDATGRKVFSDTPPPDSVAEKNILKRPGGLARTSASGPAAATTESKDDAASAPKPSGRDELLEARKKQAEEAEQAKKKAEAERLSKVRAENCERAKSAKATLSSGVRLATTNAKGEREIMDDAARAREAKRLDDIIRADCSAQ